MTAVTGMNLLDKLLVLHLVVIGCLIISSRYFPKLLGVLFVFASCGYRIDSFGTVLLPQFEAFYTAVVLATVPAGLAFAFWLLIKGVNSDKQRQVLSPA